MNKHKMRGIICAFFASTLLVGCNSNASDAVPINEISFNDTVIKYNENNKKNNKVNNHEKNYIIRHYPACDCHYWGMFMLKKDHEKLSYFAF